MKSRARVRSDVRQRGWTHIALERDFSKTDVRFTIFRKLV